MNAPRLAFAELPPLQWRGKRCVSSAAAVCAAMAWLRLHTDAVTNPYGDAARMRTRLWLEMQNRMMEER